MDEKERAFQWWQTGLYCDRNTPEGKERVKSAMSHSQEKIIPTRWPTGEVFGLPASQRLVAMADLLAQTHLRLRWNNDLGMVEFYKVDNNGK